MLDRIKEIEEMSNSMTDKEKVDYFNYAVKSLSNTPLGLVNRYVMYVDLKTYLEEHRKQNKAK